MSLPRYSQYKDSDAAWLGELPAHWKLKRVKRLVNSIEQGWSPQCENFAVDGEDEWGVLKVGCVNGGVFNPLENKKLPSELMPIPGLSITQGDLLISRANTRELVGSAAVVMKNYGNLLLCDKLYRLRLKGEQCSPHFLSYYLGIEEVRNQIELAATGASSSMLNIGQAVILELPVPLPPFKEQLTITAFVDRETGKIDELIAEQEKLLTLLAEKRQATISHAVTRGLNPDAPMKDSGVAWLGELPAHWKTGKIQSFARRESGHTPSRQHPEYWENCTIPWFSLADVWQIRSGIVKYVYETKELVSELGLANSSARLLPAGTVILSRTASVGYSAIMGCDMATTQDFVNWVCDSNLRPEFLLYVLRGMKSEFDRLMMGSTHQTIYMPDIAKLAMALPPKGEQAAIVEFLDTETGKLDSLVAEAERAIALLKERRSALIAAAVTGKIYVCDTVAEELAA